MPIERIEYIRIDWPLEKIEKLREALSRGAFSDEEEKEIVMEFCELLDSEV